MTDDLLALAELLRHGLVRGRFVPDQPQRELRELTRSRTALVQKRTAEVNRVQKALEGAHVKLAAVAVGHSILGIVDHLLSGGTVDADLGVTSFDERDRQQVERRLVNRLEALGYHVTLELTAPAA